MTTESNHNDPRVSEAYQGLATEDAPPELDRKILALAASKSRSRYGLAIAWVRPVAWAGIIGLSLAIVLEISQLSYETTPQFDADNIETTEEALILDEAPARENDDDRLQRESAKRSDVPAPLQLNGPAAKQASSPPAAAETAPTRNVELATDNVSVADDFVADDMSLLREAEEQARSRSGSEPTATPAVEALSFDAAATLEKKEQVHHCDPDKRSSAEDWYTCIEDLRAQGLSSAADSELLLLLTEFPGFEESKQSR
jgi:hypothetical protein